MRKIQRVRIGWHRRWSDGRSISTTRENVPLNFAVKIQKKYQNLGHKVLMITLEKDRRGLGISLAGHKDRNRMAVFVCGLNPKGAAHKNGGLRIGDEILEVRYFFTLSPFPRVFTTCHLRPRFPTTTSSGCLTFVSRAVYNPFNSPVATLRVAGFLGEK